MPRGRRPGVTPKKVGLALKQVVAGSATDAALLGVADVLAEIARETGGPLAQKQSLRGVKDGQ